MELGIIIKWWFFIFLIGIIFYPAVSKIFYGFYDKGYMFSKTIGIIVLSFSLWFLSSLRIVPFLQISILLFMVVFAVVIYFLYIRKQKDYFELHKPKIKIYIAQELVFLVLIIFWSYLRGLNPDILGLEKPSDFAMLNAIIRAKFMPPMDMWFAGEGLNYYYFGQYITAFLTKLTAIKSSITFNLMISTLFAFAFTLAFSISSNMFYLFKITKINKKVLSGKKSKVIKAKKQSKKSALRWAILAGIITAFLFTFGGNLHAFLFGHLLPTAKKHNINIHKLIDENIKVETEKDYWFWETSRYVGHNPESTEDQPIIEVPIFSFVISDLHAHVINIPFILTLLGLLLMLCIRTNDSQKKQKRQKWYVLSHEFYLVTLLIAIFQMLNYWDFPIYFTVATVVFFYCNFLRYKFTKQVFTNTIYQSTLCMGSSLLLTLPFSLNFEMAGKSIAMTTTTTAFHQLVVLWGYQLFLFVSFLVLLLIEKSQKNKIQRKPKPFRASLKLKIRRVLNELEYTDAFCLILAVCGIGLIIIPEIIYVDDIYDGTAYRFNTYFKVTYQAFILLTILTGYFVVRILSKKSKSMLKTIISVVIFAVIAMPMFYPFHAIKSNYHGLDSSKYKGLDGSSFLSKSSPEYYEVIKWLDDNVDNQTVVLEAIGGAYQFESIVSTYSGFATILGWYGHESVWRHSNTIAVKLSNRQNDVQTIYESNDMDITIKKLNKYNVKYIVIGKQEFIKFPKLNEPKLLSLGEVVFEKNGTKIIKLNY